MGRKQQPLASRIKRMMQANDDVGKIAAPAPVLIGVAVELFLKQLCEGAKHVAEERGARTLTPSHLKQYVESADSMEFLKPKFAEVPDLPAHEPPTTPSKSPAKPRKRARQDEAGVEGAETTTTASPKPSPKTPRAGAAKSASAQQRGGAKGGADTAHAAADTGLPASAHAATGGAAGASDAAVAARPSHAADAATAGQASVGDVWAAVAKGTAQASTQPAATSAPIVAPEDDDYDVA